MLYKTLMTAFLFYFNSLLVQAQSTPADDAIYMAFKENQFKFPPPPYPYDTIYVGEWNANNSEEFTGIKGGIIEPHGSVRTVTHLPGVAYSYSPKHVLLFKVKNNTSGFYVTIGGATYESQNGHNELFIDIKDKKLMDWKIGSGQSFYGDKLSITRKPIIAAGVFKVPYMPVVLLYEPPANTDISNPNRANKATYTRINTIGISSSISLTDERSKTTSEVSDIDKFKSVLKFAGSVIGSSDDPTAKITGTIIEKLSDDRLWGGKTTTTTKGTIKENEISFDLSEMNYGSLSTDLPSGGPGFGDMLYVLPDCKFLWLSYDGKLYTTMLSSSLPTYYTAKAIRDSIASGRRKDVFIALSKFDPFIASGPRTNLKYRSGRFEFLQDQSIDMNGNGSFIGGKQRQIQRSDRNSFTDYTTVVEDTRAGLLSYINLSPYSESQTIKTTFTTRNSNTIATKSISSADFNLFNDDNIRRTYLVYYDKLFGTFALQDPAATDDYRPVPPVSFPGSVKGTKNPKDKTKIKKGK